jgi:hypothetical protein
MDTIKQITIKSTTYDIQATYDINGNDITTTYATKSYANDLIEKQIGIVMESDY